jgi:hypothetical protein
MRLNAKPGSLPNDADNLLSDCASILAGGLEKTFALQDKGLNYPLTWAARLVVRAMPRYVNNDLSVFDADRTNLHTRSPKKAASTMKVP